MSSRGGISPQSIVECLPDWFKNYAALHLDTISKLINHVILFTGFCDFILFMKAWNVPTISGIGFNTVLVSFLLGCQNYCSWVIFNNSRFDNMRFLKPTEFMVGVSLGITIGGALLALTMSNYYGGLGNFKCPEGGATDGNSINGTSPLYAYICENLPAQRRMSSFSFWSGLVFWLGFCLSLLIAMGRHDLTQAESGGSSQYENIPTNETDQNFRQYAQQQQQQQHQHGIVGTFADALPIPSFVGNYSTVPEIQNGVENLSGGGSFASSSIPTTKTPLDPV